MLNEKLAALRRGAGMSQQEVATAIGVARQTVSNWELGQGSPALDKAAELARLYGVTLDDLVSNEVGVVSSGRGARPRDLHVLRALVGKKGTIEHADQMMPDATILDVTEGWLRVSCTVKTATLGKPKVTSAQTIQLIDLADVCAISVDGEA
ncbi:MAG TPA: helix-turn-helix transcriptional regulator [Candidatus Limicola stercorigallinarum]|nr:helix-turn-helix transcriptional regulator [Candidatus Limicola stercorigallinarum]